MLRATVRVTKQSVNGRKWNAVDGSIELETNDELVEAVDDDLDDRLDDEMVQRIDRRAV